MAQFPSVEEARATQLCWLVGLAHAGAQARGERVFFNSSATAMVAASLLRDGLPHAKQACGRELNRRPPYGRLSAERQQHRWLPLLPNSLEAQLALGASAAASNSAPAARYHGGGNCVS